MAGKQKGSTWVYGKIPGDQTGVMGKDSVTPPEGGGDNRQHDDESLPARRRTKRGRQTKGKSWAGTRTQFHAVITSDGKLVEGFLTSGAVHEMKVAVELVE